MNPTAIAIHQGGAFPARWLAHAQELGVPARLINGYQASFWEELRGCQALLWHLNQDDPLDLEHARNILRVAELAGLRVFPNHATCWHFDDKIAQVHLLEAIGAPVARTWVFFSRDEALDFLAQTRYPLVFKLRRGAGSMNVQLVSDRAAGESLVRRMFGRGIKARPLLETGKRTLGRARKALSQQGDLLARGRRVLRQFWRLLRNPPREQGYALFQEYVPGNDHDLRITVVGERVFAYRRDVRPNDFRASGSGRLRHLQENELPRDMMGIALAISGRLGFQSMAYDFVRAPGTGKPVLLEMSYVFVADFIHDCQGYLDRGEVWRPGHFWPQDLILDDLLR